MNRVSPTLKKSFWANALPGLAIIVMVFLAYGPALRAGFVWDDDKYVTDNPMLTAPDGLRQIWFSAHTQSQYFPLVYTTFKVERMLWGLNPEGYHLVNILLHGLNAALVWVLLGRLRMPGAWLAAAIFALHPVQVESVAWVTELKNLESLFFSLLALLAWLKVVEASQEVGKDAFHRGPDNSGKPGRGGTRPYRVGAVSGFWPWYLLALGAYLLALFAKTTTCTLPAALVLLVWLRGQRLTWHRAAKILPFVLLGLAMGLVSIWWEGNLGAYKQGLALSFSFLERALIAGRGLWFYAGKLLWPVNLAFSYPRWEIGAAKPLQYIPLAGCVVVAVVLWVWRRRLGLGVMAGVLFFVASLAPLLGFISNYTFQYSFVADHYQYTASIGLIAVFAGAVAARWGKGHTPPQSPGPFPAFLLAVLALLTWARCGAFLNADTLWRDTLAKNPESWMAHHNLAIELQNRGQLDEAIEHYRLAVLHNPRHVMAQNNLGLALASKGNLPEAIACYRAALQTAPDFVMAHNNLAVALGSQGNYAEAVTHLLKAQQLAPDSLGVLINLGDFLNAQGRTNEAFECYRKATGLFPREVEAWRRFGAAALDRGQPEQAVFAYRRAVKLVTNRVDLLVDFGNALVSQTNYNEAISTYRKALEVAPEDFRLHYNLGVVLDLRGNTEEAKKELREALRLKPDFGEARQQLIRLMLRPGK